MGGVQQKWEKVPNNEHFIKIEMKCDNKAPQTGVFKNDWITLWVITP